ncbi:MAG: DMT family transporter [Cytophagales bacterium]|nr:MAG: DMT family transporter [Cytophagales bacterium]
MQILYYAIALLAGLAITIQAGVNNQLQNTIKNPLVAVLITFLVGIGAILLTILSTQPKAIYNITNLSQVNLWQLSGGVLGAFYVCSLIYVIPKIGAANMLGYAVASQLIFAVIFDHFGWLGFPLHSISWQRVLGIGFLLIGLYFVKK